MTTDEAATKACFFGDGPGRAGPCLGSKCMAWRWEGPVMHFKDTRKDDPIPDGMVFLPEQVTEYDKKRAQTAQAPQMEQSGDQKKNA